MTSDFLLIFLCWTPQRWPIRLFARLLLVHTHFPLLADFSSFQPALSDEYLLMIQESYSSCSILPIFARQLGWSSSKNLKTLSLGSQSFSDHFCTTMCNRIAWKERDTFGKEYSRSSCFWSKEPRMQANRNHQQT